MTLTQLVTRYSAFAVVATIANLLTQRLSLAFYEGSLGVPLAIFVGTVVGLVVKFHLDKRWIFFDASKEAQSRKFGLYTLMGVITTVIFWGSEYGFWLIWQTDLMREAGAVLGLSVGYFCKYHLDKRFVFTPAAGVGGHA
ncbi:GtrA family protein [Shimia sp. R9_1]|uniref:GtrA family protein n=1 Tax=Shimia sp. R9_1 TaxID=2821111 RepID=UPI001ADA62BA|nr:GtrA family protein [Shimia sp. R9_1]MBO9409312.1 GtrA family protein [Shimia sp. R9_1]